MPKITEATRGRRKLWPNVRYADTLLGPDTGIKETHLPITIRDIVPMLIHVFRIFHHRLIVLSFLQIHLSFYGLQSELWLLDCWICKTKPKTSQNYGQNIQPWKKYPRKRSTILGCVGKMGALPNNCPKAVFFAFSFASFSLLCDKSFCFSSVKPFYVYNYFKLVLLTRSLIG